MSSRTTAVILALIVALAGLAVQAHPGKDDVNAPYGGNTWDTRAWPTTDDGAQDLTDVDNDGVRDGQFDAATFYGTHQYNREPGLLRQPVDYESPGLIMFENRRDELRHDTPFTGWDFSQGALRLPAEPYNSALTWQEYLPGYAAHACPPLPPPQRPDNDQPIGTMVPGTVGDMAGTLFAPNDHILAIDAVENIQTAPPTPLDAFSVLRYHLNEDKIAISTNNNSPLVAPDTEPRLVEGKPDAQSVSLPHDGFFFGKFERPVLDGPGPDIRVHELSNYGFGLYCLYGAVQWEGPYYLIGTSYGGGVEDFDLSTYYNFPGGEETGGPIARYIGLAVSAVNLHVLRADFTWSPDVRPNGHPIGAPTRPVRDDDVQFTDTSFRHGHPTWLTPLGAPDIVDETEDPIVEHRWTFNDPHTKCQGAFIPGNRCAVSPPATPKEINWTWLKDPIHKFSVPGVYNVCHSVITAGEITVPFGISNSTDTVCKDVDIWNYDPTPTMRFAQLGGCVPNAWRFWGDATDPEDDTIVSYEWDFGEGNIGDGPIVTHQFPTNGGKNVRLRVTDLYGGFGIVDDQLITFETPNTPPVITKIPDRVVVAGSTLTFTIKGHDAGCGALDYNWYGLPAGVIQTAEMPPTFTWTPKVPGVYRDFTYMVSDGEFSVAGTTTFTVIAPSGDTDGDGSSDLVDNCPAVPNHHQKDTNKNGIGDACDEPLVRLIGVAGPLGPDSDLDLDGILDHADNCPTTKNPGQFDLDGDGLGDECDADVDGDGVVQVSGDEDVQVDNCPFHSNPGQADRDGDGLGDACDGSDSVPLELKPRTAPERIEVNTELHDAEFGSARSILISGSVIGIAALLAGVLVAQGIRSGRLKRER